MLPLRPPRAPDRRRGVARTLARLLTPLALVVGLALTGAACGEASRSNCNDKACPANQACHEGVCQAIEPPAATGELGRFTAAAVRSDGSRVLITYDATNTNLLRLSEEEDGTLGARVLAGFRIEDHALIDVDAGRWASLAVDAEDTVHLAWYDAFEGAVRYGRLSADDALTTEAVDPEEEDGDRGTHTAIEVDAFGGVHLVYRDVGARSLRYAMRHPVDGTWASQVVPVCAGEEDCPGEAEDYGEYAGIVLGAQGPRVGFYDRLRGDLKLAELAGDGTWTVTTLDGRDAETHEDTGDVGRFLDMTLDPKRRLALAYYDATRSSLRYLFPSGPAPEPLLVDDGLTTDPATGALRSHPVGQHVSLSFDALGRASLLYLDAGRLMLRLARVDGATITGPWDLPALPPGRDMAIVVQDGRVRGAYGAWPSLGTDGDPGASLETSIELLDLPAAGP